MIHHRCEPLKDFPYESMPVNAVSFTKGWRCPVCKLKHRVAGSKPSGPSFTRNPWSLKAEAVGKPGWRWRWRHRHLPRWWS